MQRVRVYTNRKSLLIPLNKCRRKTFYAPWACEEERYVCLSDPSHTYERCQYQEYVNGVLTSSFLNRQKKLQQLVAEKANSAAEDL